MQLGRRKSDSSKRGSGESTQKTASRYSMQSYPKATQVSRARDAVVASPSGGDDPEATASPTRPWHRSCRSVVFSINKSRTTFHYGARALLELDARARGPRSNFRLHDPLS
jgi:hypothetical protein